MSKYYFVWKALLKLGFFELLLGKFPGVSKKVVSDLILA